MEAKTDAEKLKLILTNIHLKGNNGASLQDVMQELQKELPKIVHHIDLAK
ncbi:hypothetical protein [Aquibacillus sediminis]|nr:hypothetical protein [Aquibacillus sediminis]